MQVNTSSDAPPLNKEHVLHEYHDVFSGLGKLPGTYHIDMDPNAKAVQGNPRRVPIPVKDELRRKFLPQLSTVCELLRRLTDSQAVFDWLPQQDQGADYPNTCPSLF